MTLKDTWTRLDQVKAEFKERYEHDALWAIPLNTDQMKAAVRLRGMSVHLWFVASENNSAWIIGVEENWMVFDAMDVMLHVAVTAYLSPPKMVKDHA